MSRLQGPSPLCVPAPFVGTFGGAVGLFYVWVLLPKSLIFRSLSPVSSGTDNANEQISRHALDFKPSRLQKRGVPVGTSHGRSIKRRLLDGPSRRRGMVGRSC